MAFVFRKFAKRSFIAANILIAFAFLLGCCNAFLPPQQWWFFALLGLAFPFLLLLITAFLIFWIVARSKWAILSLVCLLAGYPHIRALIGFNYGKEFSQQKPESALRVLTWNVTWFDEQTKPNRSRDSYRKEMLEFIRELDADVLCFQEYVEPNTPRKPYNNKRDITNLGYPYSYIVADYIGWKGSFQTGVAIFSRYPITDTVHLHYPGPKNFRAGESLIGTDIDFKGKKIRVYTTHLQSVLFHKNDYRNLEIIKSASDSMYEASKSVIMKLAQGYIFRGQQADIVRKELDRSPHPTIMTGDFNDIPNSYTYFQIKGDRQDAFREAGKSIGRTFANVSRTLRIDYIMPSAPFRVLQYHRYFVPYSEHYPVIADLSLEDTGD